MYDEEDRKRIEDTVRSLPEAARDAFPFLATFCIEPGTFTGRSFGSVASMENPEDILNIYVERHLLQKVNGESYSLEREVRRHAYEMMKLEQM